MTPIRDGGRLRIDGIATAPVTPVTPAQITAARLAVAARAVDADEARTMLAMLGLL